MAYYLPWLSNASGYDVQARVNAFIARHKEVRVNDFAESNTSTFEGTVDLPTPPTITSYSTVTSAAELTTALALGNNREITLAGAGWTGNINVGSHTDMRFVFSSGFMLTGDIDSYAGQRIEYVGQGSGQHVHGSTYNSYQSATDIKFLNMDIRSTSGSTCDPTNATRIAYVGCYLRGTNYVVFWANVFHFIFANCDISNTSPGTYAVFRGGGDAGTANDGGTILILDSRLVSVSAQYGFRAQEQCQKAAFWNNQFEDARIGAFAVSALIQCYEACVLDNVSYGGGVQFPYTDGTEVTSMLTYAHNDFYIAPGTGQQDNGNDDTDFLITDNPNYSPTTPPAWSRQ